MKQGGSGQPGGRRPLEGEIDVAQLKRLIEIQSQVVNLARENERAAKKRQAMQRSLTGRRGVLRRLLGLLAQLANRNRPLDPA